MRNLSTLAFICVSFLFTGCYLSHERPTDAEGMPPVPAPVCPPESTDPVVRYDVLDAVDMTVEAGTRGVRFITFRVRELAHTDQEFAEFPYRFTALVGSLTMPDGEPVFDRVRLILSDRRSNFGPDSVIAAPDESIFENELWDANMLRAGAEVVFTLEADIAANAPGGTYEVRLGDECDLTPRMWFVPEDPPTVEMPVDRIGGNSPITIHVTVTPRT